MNARSIISALIVAFILPPTLVRATIIELRNGMSVRGLHTKLANMGSDLFGGGGGNVDVRPIFMVDDDLRRVFFSRYQLAGSQDEIETYERIEPYQPVPRKGKLIGSLGSFIQPPEPFDAWGRRTVVVNSAKGPQPIIQGITRITPTYTRVQSLKTFKWDMRIATSSLPRETLTKVLENHIDATDSDQRLSVVRLYLQSERYQDAEAELRSVIEDFPELAELNGQLIGIHRLQAKQKLGIIRQRQAAGQHGLVWNLLSNFPADNTPPETLLEIRELHQDYQLLLARIEAVRDRVQSLVAELEDGPLKTTLDRFSKELKRDLSVNTITRLANFERLADDESLTGEQQLALALSGWLLGGGGEDNMPLAVSLYRTRAAVRRYLTSQSIEERKRILQDLGSELGYAPRFLAKLLASMAPPRSPFVPADENGNSSATTAATPEPTGESPEPTGATIADEEVPADPPADGLPPGQFEYVIPGTAERPFEYVVQLPPEYDPLRRYPTIVVLHGRGMSAELELDWWAGGFHPDHGVRRGPSMQHGFIVIAPRWAAKNQRRYYYTATEHATVLYSLRDALQRFSMDTDRVFLAGHSMGGDAAWDLALAHPDTWAGLVTIGARAEYSADNSPKFVSKYWENAKYVPSYFVGGEKDPRWLKSNDRDFNRYLRNAEIDTMIVEYRGRGHESFSDEIQNIFQWMRLQKRKAHETFEVHSLRPWDNFFWWAEVDDFPPKALVMPPTWPKRGVNTTKIKGAIRNRKIVQLTTGTGKAKIYLRPENIEFGDQTTIYVNGKVRHRGTKADSLVMLEDARRRGDRQNVFWAEIEVNTRRRN